MSDQHRPDVTGYEGNSIVRTPTLDRLAETGVVFRNAYTPSPVCVPGRQCMMAGQLPKTCGCESFWSDLSPGYMTFARRFSQYAYNTVCAGKLHHHGIDQMQGWTQRIAPDAEMAPRYIEGLREEELARYKPAPGTGKWSNQREVEEARAAEGPYQKFDARVMDATSDFLERYFSDPVYRRPQSHRPLLFKASFLQPHYPFFTDEERFAYYHDRVAIYRDEPCDHPVLSLSQQNKPVHVSDEAIRRATAAYYGMIDQVDEYFGRILDQLEDLGEDVAWRNESVSQMGSSWVMIKQDDLKYQYYGDDVPEVLFDLEKDPGEITNWAREREYADVMERFCKRLGELGHGKAADPRYRNAGYATRS